MGTDAGRRRRTSRMVTLACAGVLLLPVTACAAEPSPAPTSAPPTAAPIFATDEDALAAAEEAYANYQAMSDQIDNEAGASPERIAPFVSESYYPSAVHQSDGFREMNARSVGSTSFTVAGPQQLSYPTADEMAISLYICDDVSAVDVLDENDVSLVPNTRVPVTPFSVGFVLNSEGDLVVDTRDVWKGTNFC